MAKGGWFPCCGKCRAPLLDVKPKAGVPVVCSKCTTIWDGSELTDEEVENPVTRAVPRGPERTVMWELKVAMRHLLSMWEQRAQMESAQGKPSNLYEVCEQLTEVLASFAWPERDPRTTMEDQYARTVIKMLSSMQRTDLERHLDELLVLDPYVRHRVYILIVTEIKQSEQTQKAAEPPVAEDRQQSEPG